MRHNPSYHKCIRPLAVSTSFHLGGKLIPRGFLISGDQTILPSLWRALEI